MYMLNIAKHEAANDNNQTEEACIESDSLPVSLFRRNGFITSALAFEEAYSE
jgi:hypothetical protein